MFFSNVILLGLILSGEVTSECSNILYVDNSTLNFDVKTNFSLFLSFSNITKPVEIELVPSWSALHTSTQSLLINDDSERSVSLVADYPYVYDLEVLCRPVSEATAAAARATTGATTASATIKTNIGTIRIVSGKGQTDETLNVIFGIGLNVFLAIAMLVMGCDLDFDMIVEYLKKPIGPVIGLCCQFLGMPLIAFLLGYIFLRDSPFARLGLLLIGSSPGGSASNFWTVLFKGDMNLSVTMTFCSSIASFGMTTLWVSVLGAVILVDAGGISIPYIRVFISLLSLVVPLCLGILLAKKYPEHGKRLKRLSRPIFLAFVLAATLIGLYTNRYFWVIVSWQDIVSGMLLGVSGYITGVVASKLAGLTRAQTVAVSIETAIQNPGIAVVILQSNFTSPYSDIGILPVLAFIVCATGPPLITIFTTLKILECIRKRTGKEDEEIKKEGGETEQSIQQCTPSSYGAAQVNAGFEQSEAK